MVICRRGKMLNSKVAANGSYNLVYKMERKVRKQVGYNPKRDYPRTREQISYIGRICLGRRDRSREFPVSFGRNQNVLITLSYSCHGAVMYTSWAMLASNRCVGLYRTFGVGPDVWRPEGDESDERYAGVKIMARPFGFSLFIEELVMSRAFLSAVILDVGCPTCVSATLQ